MKRYIIILSSLFTGFAVKAQTELHSSPVPQTSNTASPSTLIPAANAQPVPNSTATEKSAVTPKPLVVLPSTYIPPIYPGAEVSAPATQPNLILPASPPAVTQPAQREPLTPVESTNNLNPTRPPREEASRNNPPVEIRP